MYVHYIDYSKHYWMPKKVLVSSYKLLKYETKHQLMLMNNEKYPTEFSPASTLLLIHCPTISDLPLMQDDHEVKFKSSLFSSPHINRAGLSAANAFFNNVPT